MADSQYIFERSGTQARVTDGADFTIIVKERGDDIGLNVKDDVIFSQYPAEVQAAAEKLGEGRTNSRYEATQFDFWQWADDCAKRYGFDQVFQDGHSGGWLNLSLPLQLTELEEPVPADQTLRDRALACFFEIAHSIEEEWRPRFFEELTTQARYLGKCPNCTKDIDLRVPGHETGCVFGALLTVIEDRDEVLLADYAIEDFNIDVFWDRIGRLVTDLEQQLRELHPREKEAAQ